MTQSRHVRCHSGIWCDGKALPCRRQLCYCVMVQVSTGEVKRIGNPRMYAGMSASPDGRYIVAAWLERPFSLNVPCGRFPKRLQLWDR